MTNAYYNSGSVPATNAQGSSAAIRAEFAALTSAFNLLPTIAGNAGKVLRVNAAATALEAYTPTLNGVFYSSAAGIVNGSGLLFDGAKLGVGMTPVKTLDVTGTLGTTGAATIGGAATVAGQATFSLNGTNAAPTVLLSSNRPTLNFFESDAAANNGNWNVVASVEAFFMQAISDDGNTGNAFMQVERTGITINSVAFPTTTSSSLIIGAAAGLGGTATAFIYGTGGNCALHVANALSSQTPVQSHNRDTTGNNYFAEFGTESSFTARGSITYNRAGGLTAYNTTSDYRSKDVYWEFDGSGQLIDSLTVYLGRMHGSLLDRPLMIAHEVAETAPYAVTGAKDAVNEDGTPRFQQLDVSTLVPLLIAEIKSLRNRVSQLEMDQ